MSPAPSFREVILRVIDEERFDDLLCALPGKVVAYDGSTQSADVQPLIKSRVRGEAGTVVERRAVITHTPVMFPAWGGFRLAGRLPVGTVGLLVFASESLDLFAATGNEVDPRDVRRQAPSDAVFIPGLAARPDAIDAADSANPVIGYADAEIEFTGSEIRAGGTSRLVTRDDLLNHTHGSFGAPPTEIAPSGFPGGFPGTSKLRGG